VRPGKRNHKASGNPIESLPFGLKRAWENAAKPILVAGTDVVGGFVTRTMLEPGLTLGAMAAEPSDSMPIPHHKTMTYAPPHSSSSFARAGFSLVEMVVVIAMLVMLIGSSAMYVSGRQEHARRTVTDQLVGMIGQARNTAMVSRSTVMLAIAEPGSLPFHEGKCVLGLVKLEAAWDAGGSGPISGVLLGRWTPLESGVILMGGDIGGLGNPLDLPELRIRYTTGRTIEAGVRGVAFNARGRLIHPAGSAPVVMRIAEGGYPGGAPTPLRRGPDQRISETWLKIGRATGRAYEVTP
jgi:prepilin-type N-terminal cleavage/methylation domain-containing protein